MKIGQARRVLQLPWCSMFGDALDQWHKRPKMARWVKRFTVRLARIAGKRELLAEFRAKGGEG